MNDCLLHYWHTWNRSINEFYNPLSYRMARKPEMSIEAENLSVPRWLFKKISRVVSGCNLPLLTVIHPSSPSQTLTSDVHWRRSHGWSTPTLTDYPYFSLVYHQIMSIKLLLTFIILSSKKTSMSIGLNNHFILSKTVIKYSHNFISYFK
jgi:hypothetical protein